MFRKMIRKWFGGAAHGYNDGGKGASDTVKDALRQIETKKYETALIAKGIPRERIRKYGFAFCGKKVLIGRADVSVPAGMDL